MRFYRLPGRLSWAPLLLVAIVLAATAIPAQAVPCDGYRLDAHSLGTQSVEVVVATDEAWRQTYGAGAEATASQLLADANRILEPAGIGLSLAGYRTWSNEEKSGSMSQLLAHLDDTMRAEPGQLVIGLTGRQISRVDGLAHVGHIHLVARLHPDRPELDGLVVAHEIGHLLGAGHHHCGHGYQCVMAPEGFAFPARWCEHHILEMQLGAASLAAE